MILKFTMPEFKKFSMQIMICDDGDWYIMEKYQKWTSRIRMGNLPNNKCFRFRIFYNCEEEFPIRLEFRD